MAAAAMATLAAVEAATITPLFYPDACEGNLSAALRVAAAAEDAERSGGTAV
jgi:hypothetical protein